MSPQNQENCSAIFWIQPNLFGLVDLPKSLILGAAHSLPHQATLSGFDLKTDFLSLFRTLCIVKRYAVLVKLL